MRDKLIVIDMQNDFIDGSLSNPAAKKIIPDICRLVENFDGDVYYTLDTHQENYLETAEGKNLPIKHCIKDTDGHRVNSELAQALAKKGAFEIEKPNFGYLPLANAIYEMYDEEIDKNDKIYLVGTCTDICVISNALILKAAIPETEVVVYGNLCAGTTPENHQAALIVMSCCQVKVKDWE